jgi:hypothetical protein
VAGAELSWRLETRQQQHEADGSFLAVPEVFQLVSIFVEEELLRHRLHPEGRRYLPHLHPAHHPQHPKILPTIR